MHKNTISFYTLGCRLNQSETAVVQHSFEKGGYKITPFNQPSDIAVINTCTVTENGDTDTRRLVNRINRMNPNSRIALIGCQAQIQKEKLTALPNVRWVVGNAKKIDLIEIIKNDIKDDRPKVITPPMSKESFIIPTAGIDHQHTRANIKIQDGCDFFCSFCEIPYARGRARSRQFEDIISEAKVLTAARHKELVLTGINIGTYKQNGKTILDVINALEQINGLERIRISSIELTTIPSKLIEKMATQTKLCRHLHIPLQNTNDQILKSMKRKYTFREFNHFIQTAVAIVPGICIGTDILVGFPGETDEIFEQMLNSLKEIPVHYFHVFSYSKRNMAKSQNLPEMVSQLTIQKRSKILRELGLRKRRIFYQSLIATTQKVLFEQKKDGYWRGLTDNYIRVKVKSQEALANQFMNVVLQKLEGMDVYAQSIKSTNT